MAYRSLVIKRVGGKVKRYKSLASFNSECPKRRFVRGNVCAVTKYRFTRRGSCLATVKSAYPGGDENIFHRGAKRAGTWVLHFQDCGIMRRHLQGRVEDKTKDAWLSGARRRRR